jgi:hypothetical protein
MSQFEERRERCTVERRTAVRYICKLKAACIQGVTAEFHPSKLARVNDISTGGLGLHLGESFVAGTQLTVRLHTLSGEPVSELKEVRVAHASEQPDGTWVLGVAFLQPLGEAEVQALLAK